MAEPGASSTKSRLGRFATLGSAKRPVERGQRTLPKLPLGLVTLHTTEDDVVCDLIFVHGLNGDSQNTWCKDGEPSRFWPKEWLPKDPAFLDTPLVLIGHSMGGLVIKKACILGREIPEFQALISRIRAIFFLATPHQGANIAITLSRVLSAMHGSRSMPFVDDLLPQSPILQSINDVFPKLCDDHESMRLYSFFETKPMYYGIRSGLIVEKSCAVMGYPRERRTHLDANHRDVARFSSTEDASYITVRNALAALLDDLRANSQTLRREIAPDERAALATMLNIPDSMEDDLIMQDMHRLNGSGNWLFQDENFMRWQDACSSKLLWLRGRPGAGKSFLAGNVVNHLRQAGLDCSIFFFASNDSQRSTVGALLRSMAFQMALIHPEMRSNLRATFARNDTHLDLLDHNAFWRQIYSLGGLLKVKLNRQQYWVIDAMDECVIDTVERHHGATEMMKFLAKAQEAWPLSIFVTSRDPFEPSLTQQIEVANEIVLDEDSQKDILIFLKINTHLLPAATVEAQQELADYIYQNSRGCFLWAILILKELRHVHTSAEAKMVLESNLSEMRPLYQRILNDMAKKKFGKHLAKSILTWTVCSHRPLSKDELCEAVQLDIKDTITDIESFVSSYCGSLVYLDNRNRFQLIHLTAREFLLDRGLDSEFAINKSEAHTRIALASLDCLMVERRGAQGRSKLKSSCLLGYASEFLFQHLVHTRSTNDDVLIILARFLRSKSVLRWIEHCATQSMLPKLHQAGKTMVNLLNRQRRQVNPLSMRMEIETIEGWARDMRYLVIKFSHQLRSMPSSIHHLIPPFCPSGSVIRKHSYLGNRGLIVTGLSASGWEEYIRAIDYKKSNQPFSAASGAGLIALGMRSGEIFLYDDAIFQELKVLDHKEPVWRLRFGGNGKLLASSGAKCLRIWDLDTWTELHQLPTEDLPIVISFTENDTALVVATKANKLLYWDLGSGELLHDTNWAANLEDTEGFDFHMKAPTIGDFQPHHNLLAIIYHRAYILIWDAEYNTICDIYEKSIGSTGGGEIRMGNGATCVRALAFGSAPDTSFLAASYLDGDLVVFDFLTGQVQVSLQNENIAFLSSSPDGQVLAGAKTDGSIFLYDFYTLRCLCRISITQNAVASKAVLFTDDGQRLVDVRHRQTLIWQPNVLYGQELEEKISETVSVTTLPQDIDFRVAESVPITAICAGELHGGSVVFAGKKDGSVHALGNLPNQMLFVHNSGCPITELHFENSSEMLSCRDLYSRVSCRKISLLPPSGLTPEDRVMTASLDLTILQILVSSAKSAMLVSAKESTVLLPLDGGPNPKPKARFGGQITSRWISYSSAGMLIFVTERSFELRSWSNLDCLKVFSCQFAEPTFTRFDCSKPLRSDRFIATISTDPALKKPSQVSVHIWDLEGVITCTEPLKPKLCIRSATTADRILGILGQRLIYVDENYWVCSEDLVQPEDLPRRHFFIPNDWLGLTNELIMDIGKDGEVS